MTRERDKESRLFRGHWRAAISALVCLFQTPFTQEKKINSLQFILGLWLQATDVNLKWHMLYYIILYYIILYYIIYRNRNQKSADVTNHDQIILSIEAK